MSKQAKIAALPREVRDAVSKLLDCGKTNAEVAEHVNEIIRQHPDANVAQFTEKNVATWRKTGYRHWLAAQSGRIWLDQIEDIANTRDPSKPTHADVLAAVLSTELLIETLFIKQNYQPGPERLKQLVTVAAALVNLRRSDQGKGRLRVDVANARVRLAKLDVDDGVKLLDLEDVDYATKVADMLQGIDQSLASSDEKE